MHILEAPQPASCGHITRRLFGPNNVCQSCRRKEINAVARAQDASRAHSWGFPWGLMLGVLHKLEWQASKRATRRALERTR